MPNLAKNTQDIRSDCIEINCFATPLLYENGDAFYTVPKITFSLLGPLSTWMFRSTILFLIFYINIVFNWL